MDPETTGKQIQEYRKNNNLTQKDLASKLNVTDKAVSKWERGLSFPDISLLIPLSEILNISIYELLKGEKMKKEEKEVINKKDVDKVIKNTIQISEDKTKRNKKKYIIIILSILLIAILSTSIFAGKIMKIEKEEKEEKLFTSASPTNKNIKGYLPYVTTISDKDKYNIEFILVRMPMQYHYTRPVIDVENKTITREYIDSEKDIRSFYSNEKYLEKAVVYGTTVMFLTIDGVETINYQFKDKTYTISRDKVIELYNNIKFNDLKNEDTFKKEVINKIKDNNIANEMFSKIIN